MLAGLKRLSLRTRVIMGIITAFVAGSAAGGALVAGVRPIPAMAPAPTKPIAQAIVASDASISDPLVTVRGEVVAVFGDGFAIKDASGQALVHLGSRHGMSGLPKQMPGVAVGQTVTAQARFDEGTVRAEFIVTADGKAWAMGNHRNRHHHDNARLAHRPVATQQTSSVQPIAPQQVIGK